MAFASSAGNAVELYDFLLYGTASALVFDKLFFPSFDPRIGTLLSLATFGAGFLARPLGGVVVVVVAMVIGFAAIFGPMPAYYAELFGPKIRYSGVSLSYQLGAVLGGGLSPVIATALLGVTADRARWPVSLYLVGGAVVSAVCVLAIGEAVSGRERCREPVEPRIGG